MHHMSEVISSTTTRQLDECVGECGVSGNIRGIPTPGISMNSN